MGLQAILMFSVLTVSRAVIDKVDLGWSSGISWTSLEFILWNAVEVDERDISSSSFGMQWNWMDVTSCSSFGMEWNSMDLPRLPQSSSLYPDTSCVPCAQENNGAVHGIGAWNGNIGSGHGFKQYIEYWHVCSEFRNYTLVFLDTVKRCGVNFTKSLICH